MQKIFALFCHKNVFRIFFSFKSLNLVGIEPGGPKLLDLPDRTVGLSYHSAKWAALFFLPAETDCIHALYSCIPLFSLKSRARMSKTPSSSLLASGRATNQGSCKTSEGSPLNLRFLEPAGSSTLILRMTLSEANGCSIKYAH
jgi:hypothetical protein